MPHAPTCLWRNVFAFETFGSFGEEMPEEMPEDMLEGILEEMHEDMRMRHSTIPSSLIYPLFVWFFALFRNFSPFFDLENLEGSEPYITYDSFILYFFKVFSLMMSYKEWFSDHSLISFASDLS